MRSYMEIRIPHILFLLYGYAGFEFQCHVVFKRKLKIYWIHSKLCTCVMSPRLTQTNNWKTVIVG